MPTTKTTPTTTTAAKTKIVKQQRWVPPTARENLDPTEVVFRTLRGYVYREREREKSVRLRERETEREGVELCSSAQEH